MPIEKTIKLFRYDELSESAKERAREWYLSGLHWPEELDFVLEHWWELAEKLGFIVDDGPWWDLYQRTFKIGRGRFHRAFDEDLDALTKEYAHNPTVLSIVQEVREIHWNFSAFIEDGKIESFDLPSDYDMEPKDDDEDAWAEYYEKLKELTKKSVERLEDALSELQGLGLKWLQEEADYIESEEAIASAMAANEWLFYEDGTFAE